MNHRQQQAGTTPVEIHRSHVGESDGGVTWFCCVDNGIRLFEKQYPLADGMSYDSYIIEDEKLVVVDTVDQKLQVFVYDWDAGSVWTRLTIRWSLLGLRRWPDFWGRVAVGSPTS